MASYEFDLSSHSEDEEDEGDEGLVRASESSKALVVPKPVIGAPRISKDSQQARRPSAVTWKTDDVSNFGEA
eukprot:scaffold134940_cov85-Attheya_sp.AAC.1